ncbi:MAG: Hsp20/alpha crystallin family protein [Chloroflexi bacterium]|nr:Hsp20/alpha crystallin family protein [Chloroflexota bacterium]
MAVAGETLTIRGDKKMDSGVEEESYQRSEIDYGSFYRSVTLPAEVDTSNIEAVYQDGVLRITIHRASGARTKKVPIQVKK